MASFLVVAFNDAMPGEDEAYNAWHETVHIPEVLAVPGVTAARRYRALNPASAPGGAGYLVLYELDCDDPAAVMAEFGRRAETTWTPRPDAADPSKTRILMYERRL